MRRVVATIGTPVGSPETVLEGPVMRLSGGVAKRLDRLLSDGGVEYVDTHRAVWLQPAWGRSVISRDPPVRVVRQRLPRRRRWLRDGPRYELQLPDVGVGPLRGGDEISLSWEDGAFEVRARCGSAVLVRHMVNNSDAFIRDRIRVALGEDMLRPLRGVDDFAQAKEWLDALGTTLAIVENAIVGRYADLAAERELVMRGSHLVVRDHNGDRQHRVTVDRFEEFDAAAAAYAKLRYRVMRLFELPGKQLETGMLAEFRAFLGLVMRGEGPR
jgi:hypothetical protein